MNDISHILIGIDYGPTKQLYIKTFTYKNMNEIITVGLYNTEE